jgi:hypothetical protein
MNFKAILLPASCDAGKNTVGTSPTLANFEKLLILLLQLKIFFKIQKKMVAIFAKVCVRIDQITLYNDPLAWVGKDRFRHNFFENWLQFG